MGEEDRVPTARAGFWKDDQGHRWARRTSLFSFFELDLDVDHAFIFWMQVLRWLFATFRLAACGPITYTPPMLFAMRASNLAPRVGIPRAVRLLSTSAPPVPGVVEVTPSGNITEEDVIAAQVAWTKAIIGITKVYKEGGDFVAAAGYCAGVLYGYGHSKVLFKPTRATNNPFRPKAEDAMAYFVGANAMDNHKFDGEDNGFAINGGQGWSRVVFRNHDIDLNGNTAVAMGDYVFTNATSGAENRVEYTFGYKTNDDGNMRIFLCAPPLIPAHISADLGLSQPAALVHAAPLVHVGITPPCRTSQPKCM